MSYPRDVNLKITGHVSDNYDTNNYAVFKAELDLLAAKHSLVVEENIVEEIDPEEYRKKNTDHYEFSYCLAYHKGMPVAFFGVVVEDNGTRNVIISDVPKVRHVAEDKDFGVFSKEATRKAKEKKAKVTEL